MMWHICQERGHHKPGQQLQGRCHLHTLTHAIPQGRGALVGGEVVLDELAKQLQGGFHRNVLRLPAIRERKIVHQAASLAVRRAK